MATQGARKTVHGQDPQNLIEKVIRARIYESTYWKEHCFALTAESLIDKAIVLHAIGGVYERQTPTPFICLLLRLLQLQPEKEILFEYLLAEEFKYLRALAAIYVRLTFRSMDVFQVLEPLMKDYRKLRYREVGGYRLTTFDEFVDDLLIQDRVCDIILPRLTQRKVLEEVEGLAPRQSLLEDDPRVDKDDDEEGAGGDVDMGEEGDTRRGRSRSRSGSAASSRSGSRFVSRSPSRSRSGSPASEGRFVSRSPSRSASEDEGEEGDTRGRYVSRSPSMSPDRLAALQADKIEGDV